EGRDAAGKGGTIKRFMEHVNPRGARVVALEKPSEVERGQWYFQRYLAHLPTAGEIVFFDRSWYNRAGVEPVMGFCTEEQHRLFLRQAPEVEQALVEDGIRLFKLFLDVDRDLQAERLQERRDDPLKSWKISPVDEAAGDRYDDYSAARDSMLAATDTDWAPWTGVNANRQKVARLHAIRHVLHALPYDGKDPEVAVAPDPAIVAPAGALLR
ncbi:MAG: polyphosphate kinase 2, partial [Acidimicrobiales bacterium]|nr:polyphosphate kinase 2 [Acidimicrobiales bacterium]